MKLYPAGEREPGFVQMCYRRWRMAMQGPQPSGYQFAHDATHAGRHRYLRAPEPVYFPESEEVPEKNENLERRVALYQSLKHEHEIAGSATIGSDQFVYWDPTTAKKRLAPDVFVRLGVRHRPFRVWKTWARGAPELGVEIISTADEGEPDWDEKLARYRAAGVGEVVRFDPEDGETSLRVWDMISGDLVERSQDDPDLRRCDALDLWWVIVKDEEIGPMLRLARDREGRELLPTPDERAAKAREDEARARQGEARARQGEARARQDAAKASEAEAKALAESERLRAEVAALKAQLENSRAPRKRKRS
jgi:Uma2 family endonuclease